ncbi:NAD(P)-dependent oxidoreductase [Vagococcus vulneris]|uniref:NAD(P)-dependent oxidoreductase n=1 Tax=Vagococcus vulneris TaxID=1977869 RepID=UPI001401F43F|nr:NAD(P)-dependent oxidoreductase [Vagococcus vulneris]
MKKILAVAKHIPLNQVTELQKEFLNYQVSYAQDLETADYPSIEIMYGWSASLGKKLLKLTDSHLKWIQAESAGVNQFDQALLAKKNILLSNASGIHGQQMSESILGMIFAYTRQIRQSILNQEVAEWQHALPTTDLAGKQIVILGTGHIGQVLAKTLSVFDVTVTGVNRSGQNYDYFDSIIKHEELPNKLSQFDILISLLPETNETLNFFNREFFKMVKKGVIFINAGRGSAVDESVLIEACQTGIVSFAGLDVVKHEPLPKTSDLWEQPNILIIPHLAGSTDQYFNRLFPIFKENLQLFEQTGDIIRNKIDLTKGY